VVITGLLVACGLILGATFLAVFSIRATSAAGSRVEHIQATLLDLNQLLTSLLDAETGQREFITTADSATLGPYNDALAILPHQINQLSTQLEPFPDQAALFQQATALITTKLAHFTSALTLQQEGRSAEAHALLYTHDSTSGMPAIRSLLHQIELQALDALANTSALAAHRTGKLQVLSLSMGILAISLTLYSIWFFARRERALESMITVCAWTKRVKYEGQWISFEQYLRARFHIEFTHSISEEAARKLISDPLKKPTT
jgi:CHASE3 domain sensor protein